MTPDQPEPGHSSAEDSSPPGMPRWVKLSGIIVVVLILVVVIIQFLTGGEHGPGLHSPYGADAASYVTEPLPVAAGSGPFIRQ